MNINKLIEKVDLFQQRRAWLAFPFAVIKKFGDDSGGYQAALITYYGFLSLFPLLLVALTIMQIIFHGNGQLQREVSENISNYFPLLGSQLQKNIHSLTKTGLGLVLSLLITLYGALGVADAIRFALDNMWQVPKSKRAGFPRNTAQSFLIILAGALGFIASVGVSGVGSILGHSVGTKILLNLLGFIIASGVLLFVFNIATSKRVPARSMILGAVLAAAIIQILLVTGGIVMANQLRGFNSLYGTFAIVLGLLFWIYLLAQVVVYAAEVDTVRAQKLWPRSITPKHRTKADHRAAQLATNSEQ